MPSRAGRLARIVSMSLQTTVARSSLRAQFRSFMNPVMIPVILPSVIRPSVLGPRGRSNVRRWMGAPPGRMGVRPSGVHGRGGLATRHLREAHWSACLSDWGGAAHALLAGTRRPVSLGTPLSSSSLLTSLTWLAPLALLPVPCPVAGGDLPARVSRTRAL